MLIQRMLIRETQVRRRWRKVVTVFLVSLVSFSLCACKVYRPLPDYTPPEPPLTKEGAVHFFFYPGTIKRYKDEPETMHRRQSEIVQRLLGDHSRFSAAIISPSPPARGTFIAAYLERKGDDLGDSLIVPAIFTLSVLPGYGEFVHVVRLELYVDADLKKTYRYEIVERVFVWIGLIPFAWMNALSTDYWQAFETTVYKFLIDGRRDGFL